MKELINMKGFLLRYNAPLTALLLFVAFALWLPGISLAPDCFSKFAGEALWSGEEHNDLLWAMPLPTALVSALKLHLSPDAAALAAQVLALSALALMFVLARQFAGSLSCAIIVLAAAVWKQSFLHTFSIDIEQLSYTLVLLVLGLALALQAKEPCPYAVWAAAVLSGIAIMIRSPIALFPPVLAVYDLWRRRGSSEPGHIAIKSGSYFVLLALPYLLLLPRLWMLWRSYGVFSFFEVGRFDNALVTGALGVASTVEHGRALAGLSGDAPILPWYFVEVLGHPLRFLGGIGKRLYFAFSLMPALYVLAAMALLRFRKSAALRMPAMLCAYLAAFYSIFCIEPRYFVPLCPLLLAMSAALSQPSRGPSLPQAEVKWRIIGWRTLKIAAGALMFFYAAVAASLIIYPSRHQKLLAAPYSAAKAAPDNAWLQNQASLKALAAGNLELAREFSALALLSSRTAEAGFLRQYLLVLALKGIDISPELDKLRRSEATGILYDTDETQFALPGILNYCSRDRRRAANVLAEVLGLEHRREMDSLKRSGLDSAVAINHERIKTEMLELILEDVRGLPEASQCAALHCLLDCVHRTGYFLDDSSVRAYSRTACRL